MDLTLGPTGSPGKPASDITDADAKEMCCTDGVMPVISQIKVSLCYSRELLAKDNGKWTPWLKFMKLKLTMSGLYKYVFDPPDVPHKQFKPRVYLNWQLNNRLALSFLMLELSKSERNLANDSVDVKTLWEYLQMQHGGAGLVQQVHLLQEALTTKCSPSEPITKQST
ncbi:hypothetical protein C0992_005214, partial [Termitomyces sp. T32_za158]